MSDPKPIRSYWVWFKPDIETKAPPRYHVVLSKTDAPQLFSATVIAMNVDTPVARDANGLTHWNRASVKSSNELCADIDNELLKLNSGKEIHYSEARWI